MGTSFTVSNVLFSKTQRRVLALLYGHTDRSYYLKEIINWVDVGRGAVQRELQRMIVAGILTKRTIGNQHHYQANPACPIYNELVSIVKKTFGIVDVLQAALMPLDAEIEFAFIYGSVAKGEETAESDVDLFIMSESVGYADLLNVLASSEHELGRPVNPSIYSKTDIRKKLKGNNAFLSRLIEQPKLWVKGSDDDFRETG